MGSRGRLVSVRGPRSGPGRAQRDPDPPALLHRNLCRVDAGASIGPDSRRSLGRSDLRTSRSVNLTAVGGALSICQPAGPVPTGHVPSPTPRSTRESPGCSKPTMRTPTNAGSERKARARATPDSRLAPAGSPVSAHRPGFRSTACSMRGAPSVSSTPGVGSMSWSRSVSRHTSMVWPRFRRRGRPRPCGRRRSSDVATQWQPRSSEAARMGQRSWRAAAVICSRRRQTRPTSVGARRTRPRANFGAQWKAAVDDTSATVLIASPVQLRPRHRQSVLFLIQRRSQRGRRVRLGRNSVALAAVGG